MKIQTYQYNNVNNFSKKQQNIRFGANVSNSKLITNRISQLIDIGYPKNYLTNFVQGNSFSIEQARTILDLKLAGCNKRDILSSYNHKVSDEELERLFFAEPHKVLNVVKLLGKKSFIASFANKFENVENYIQTFGDIKPDHPLYQKLLELTNPTESLQYKKTQARITDLKKRFQTTENKETLIKEINKLTDSNKNLVKKSLTDYPEKIELAEFFYLMKDSNEIPGTALEAYDKHNKNFLQNLLNDIVIEDSNGKQCKRLDFRKNKYLPKLISANQDFKTNYKKMLSILNQNPTKSIKNALLELPQNIATKKQFEELGVNFNRWVTFDSNSKIQKIVKGDTGEENVVKRLEQLLNSPLLGLLSDYKEQKLHKEMNINGYQLKKRGLQPAHYPVTTNERQGSLKLFKDNQAVTFKDLPPLMDILTDFIKKDSLWNSPDKNMQADIARKTIELSIKEVKQKMMLALEQPKANDVQITVQQIDMDNITHSLFLGNDASCCMAIGSGFKQAIAPNYIMNKMISGIEILADNKPIGNSMCYIAEIDNKPALILDNTEIKQDFRNSRINDVIRDMLFDYANKFGKELGIKDTSIYIGGNRNKINLYNYPAKHKEIKIIGSSGNDKIYIDSIPKEDIFNGNNYFSILLSNISSAISLDILPTSSAIAVE